MENRRRSNRSFPTTTQPPSARSQNSHPSSLSPNARDGRHAPAKANAKGERRSCVVSELRFVSVSSLVSFLSLTHSLTQPAVGRIFPELLASFSSRWRSRSGPPARSSGSAPRRASASSPPTTAATTSSSTRPPSTPTASAPSSRASRWSSPSSSARTCVPRLPMWRCWTDLAAAEGEGGVGMEEAGSAAAVMGEVEVGGEEVTVEVEDTAAAAVEKAAAAGRVIIAEEWGTWRGIATRQVAVAAAAGEEEGDSVVAEDTAAAEEDSVVVVEGGVSIVAKKGI
ncbi:CSD domain-containing protein [Psidium guajava]|nr:CSD domain-containing protein [Psidium guajava]